MSHEERVTCHHTLLSTKHGWVGIQVSPKGVRRLTLPQESPKDAMASLREVEGEGEPEPVLAAFPDLVHRLEGYFDGEETTFQDALDPVGTPFQRSVWEAVRGIPYGETRSYTWVAQQIGRPTAARAVGQAMRVNPVSIIVPCHRVIGAKGELCGYGGTRGIGLKQRLLEMEGVSVGR